MELIATLTASGSSNTITFSSIPQTYTDLFLDLSLRGGYSTNTTDWASILVNGVDMTDYKELYGSGGGGSGGSRSSARNEIINGPTSSANSFSSGGLYIPNYTNSLTKAGSLDTVTVDNAGGSAWIMIKAIVWGAAAVSSLTITAPNGNIFANSVLSLYGITKGTGGATPSSA